jgi:hypothetical protein
MIQTNKASIDISKLVANDVINLKWMPSILTKLWDFRVMSFLEVDILGIWPLFADSMIGNK